MTGVIPVLLMALGLVVGLGAIGYAAATGRLRTEPDSPAGDRTAEECRAALRRIRRADAVDPADLPFLREVARRVVRQRWRVLPPVGVVLIALGPAVRDPRPAAGFGFVLAAVLLIGAGAAFILRDAHRAAAFLRQHSADEG
ncbi:hypothetical protein ACFFWC_14750 [Plantactinospora siamensis]|uniref:Uncharacterized protein n=1 Tax=Plantactinospora siamensis TaxID=555372 RepID=A0ABV6P0Z1_9ACTN